MIYECKLTKNNITFSNNSNYESNLERSISNMSASMKSNKKKQNDDDKFVVIILSSLLKDKMWFIIKPTVPMYQLWSLVIISCIAFLMVYIPYDIAFGSKNDKFN